MRNYILIISLFFLLPIMAQKGDMTKYVYVDSVSYKMYQDARWEELTEFGNEALAASDLDYYYLRARIGYAYFMQEKYRLAIKHYKKALEFNDAPYPQEMLLLCYEYGGRTNDAQLYSQHIDETAIPYLYKKYKRSIRSFSAFYTNNTANSSAAQKAVLQDGYVNTDGFQKITNYFNNYDIGLSHRLWHFMSVQHNLSILNKNEFGYSVIGNTAYPEEGQTLSQYNYNIAAQISPFSGFSIIPSYQYIKFETAIIATNAFGPSGSGMGTGTGASSVTESGTTEATVTETSTTNTDATTSNATATGPGNGTITPTPTDNSQATTYFESTSFYSIRLQQEFALFNIGLSYAKGNLNQRKQVQYGFHGSYFPFGNLNLTYHTSIYAQRETANGQSQTKLIQNHAISSKISNMLWLELGASFGDYNNFYDTESAIVYNGIENIKSSYSLSTTILIPKTSLQILLKAKTSNVDSYLYSTSDLSTKYNSQNYNTLNLTGGILWKF